MTVQSTPLTAALKEWAVVVEGLLAGDTILLLRKGGIQEVGGRFTVAHDRVLLYPTYEHQRSHLLKSGIVSYDPIPDRVNLSAWAHITDVFQVREASQLQHLMLHHIWTEAFATERLKWKPTQPLSVLLLRVYALTKSVTLPARHRGCRSWLEVDYPIDVSESRPVLTQREYEMRSRPILAALQSAPFPHEDSG